VNLADERVDIDDKAPVAWTGTDLPRAGERLIQDAIELPDVPNVNARKNVPSVEGAITS
jgi:hypothetical protein